MKIRLLLITSALLLSGCSTTGKQKTADLLIWLFAEPESSRYDCRLPHRWDDTAKEWVIDTTKLRTRSGRRLPHKWDSETKQWVLDTTRLRYSDLELDIRCY